MTQTGEKRIFTLKEAQELLPVIGEITEAAVKEAEKITIRINDLDDEEDPHHEELQRAFVDVVTDWATRVLEFGCEVKGPWLVDFDNGHGYFCWQHPEPAVEYFHGYDEGFAGRSKIN